MADPKQWSYTDPHPGGMNVPPNHGYYVNLPHTSPAQKAPNAFIQKASGAQYYLWVTGLQAEFAMGGSFGQSSMTRSWWAHNFTAPVFTINGICANQRDYQSLSDFVRSAQLEGVRHGSPLRFFMPRGGIAGVGKGTYKTHDLRGYIKLMEHKSERFVNAPTYSLALEVELVRQGLYELIRAQGSQLKTWTQIFDQNFEVQPTLSLEQQFEQAVSNLAAIPPWTLTPPGTTAPSLSQTPPP